MGRVGECTNIYLCCLYINAVVSYEVCFVSCATREGFALACHLNCLKVLISHAAHCNHRMRLHLINDCKCFLGRRALALNHTLSLL
jgi:hypothetical protein